jgi:hypothetical protein
METDSSMMEANLFRHARKRKFVRNRPNVDSDEISSPPVKVTAPNTESPAADGPVTNVLRLRKHWATRKSGIGFSNARTRSSEPETITTDLATIDPDAEILKAITDRFVAHSGQTMDIDKHMFVH